MRFDWIRSKGLGSDREINIDLSAIPGTIVAVAGPNGAGKSVFLECLAGAIDRTLPTRGSLSELAKLTGDRQAYLEVGVTNGKSWKIRHDIDGVSGKGECSVTGPDDVEVLNDSKITSFDDWSGHTFHAPEVRYATTFAAQKSVGFLSMTPAERRKIILRVAGVERLEEKAAKARKLAAEAKGRVDVLSARLADLNPPMDIVETWHAVHADLPADHAEASVVFAERTLASAKAAYAKAKAQLDVRQGELAAIESQAEVARVAQDAEINRQRRRSEAQGRLDAARVRLRDLDSRIANNADVLAKADEIRAAASRDAEISTHIATIRLHEAEAVATLAEADKAIEAAKAAETYAARDGANADHRKLEADKRLSDRERVSKAASWVKETEADIATAKASIEETEARLEHLRAAATGVADRRIAALKSPVELYAQSWNAIDERETHMTTSWDGGRAAYEAAVADDAIATEANAAPAEMDAAHRILRGTKSRLDTLRTKLDEETRLAALAPVIEQAERDRDAAVASSATAVELVRAARVQAAVLFAQAQPIRETLDALRADLDTAAKERTGLAPTLKLAEQLTKAEARVAELKPQRDDTEATIIIERSTIAIIDGEAIVELPAMPDVAGARGLLGAAQSDVAFTGSRVQQLDEALAKAKVDAQKIAGLRTQLVADQEELSDWTRLGNDLGRDGLQNLAIDACGPAISELTNHLLHECFGPRWSVSLETQRASSDGKKAIETCDVRVFDSVEGRDVLGDRLSGGECTIVSEALALALSMYACRQAGIQECTLIRDETSAALDEKNGRAYVRMLRMAAKYTGARQVLFVTHNASMAEMADSVIHVKDGQVSVQPKE